MATVTLTDLYSGLSISPYYLLSASDGVTVTADTATTFSYTFSAGTKFAGYTVTSIGTGFTYDGTTPTDGVMSGLTITNATGQVVLTVSGILAGSMASDLSEFASYEFGWTTPNGVVLSEPENAWSQLFSGADTINGTSGGDEWGLFGVNAGPDVYNMGAGDDFIRGGMGNDTINGGDGYDTLSYLNTSGDPGIAKVHGITVNMTAGTVSDPYGNTDTFTGIERIIGSDARDTFNGGATAMTFEGLRGSDTFIGGSSGQDYVVYYDDTWNGGGRGIVVNLEVSTAGGNIIGTIVDGFGNTDHTTNIANVVGTDYNDTFVGSTANNFFRGGPGVDSYVGGGGEDTVSFQSFDNYSGAPVQHGITVNLKLTTGQIIDDGYGNTENATGISDIIGSQLGDHITGSTGANVITGAGGADTMAGGGGHDHFQWSFTEDFTARDVITDFHAAAGVEQDYLNFNVSAWGYSTTLNFVTGTAATAAVDTFLFNPATHVLSFDPDGTGPDAAMQIVVLNNINTLLAANFLLF